MGNGYMGKVLFVDLSTKQFREQEIEEDIYRKFLGGYGLGVRVLYENMKPGTDPLSPSNILGFVTGPLAGTRVISGTKVTVVSKSPLTGTWGDSTVGDGFGPELKRTGYDAVFFTGKADKPVYCFLNGKIKEIRDASHIWGKDIYETVDLVRQEAHKDAKVACIGRSGEKLSLISCLIVNKFRASGRSGLGAVMGSKNLKAFAVKGTQDISVADRAKLESLNEQIRKELEKRLSWLVNLLIKIFTPLLPFLARRKVSFPVPSSLLAQMYTNYGTCSFTASSAAMQDSPIKNWKGTQGDFPMRSKASKISGGNVVKYEKEKYGCPGCPIRCGGVVELKTGKYALNEPSYKPEYETLASFGSLLLNDDVESILCANDICNRYGVDTISAGSAIAFAIECYEAGLISKEDTGIELRWGDPDCILALLRQIVEREGFGDILADGVKVAASKIGKGSEKWAIHVGGQELPMHDPRNAPGFGATYVLDPTPGRHTAGGAGHTDSGVRGEIVALPRLGKHDYENKGKLHVLTSNIHQVITCSGLCIFPPLTMPRYPLLELLNAVTGWGLTIEELLKIGERIQMLRHCFNLREGFKPSDFRLPARVIGEPPLTSGPLKGIKIDAEAMQKSCLKEMGLDEVTGRPSLEKLRELDLEDLIQL